MAVVLLGLLATAFILRGEKTGNQFESFKARYGKSYSADEEQFRKTIFEANLERIREHNADASQTYEMGINLFADMSTQEFIDQILMKELPASTEKTVSVGGPVPNGVDWRANGAVTGVKNQGSCGSCWSFSTTGVLEGAYHVKRGGLPSYSEQQLLDCCGSKGYQCQGCSGAWPEWALNYVKVAGIDNESAYTYNGKVGACQPKNPVKIVSNYHILTAGDTAALKSAVSRSPVSVCLDASNWNLYKSGVFSNCHLTPLNHAVLLVGYEDNGNWIVKNSWGTGWGEAGYIKLASGNTCGIAQHAITVDIL